MARWEFRIRFLLVFFSLEASAQVVPSSLDFGLSRKPGSTCTFNPCNIPNFCGSGRACEIDNNCISRCVCIDDSNHPKCITKSEDGQSLAQNAFSTGKTESTDSIQGAFASNKQSNTDPETSNTSLETKCNVDPCRTMSWLCGGNRKCVTRDCILHCECTQDSTHLSCISGRPTETNETEDCGGFPGMRCVHGECVQIEDAFSCKCDENWTGPLCDQHASTGCTRHCEYGYECSWYMNTLQICKPKQTTTTTIHNSMNANSTSLSLPLNACLDGYALRPVSQRNCSSGLMCQYGVCTDNENRSSVCLCDDGAFGPTCNTTCCKDCGVGGECLLIIGDDDSDDVKETCKCYPNYFGETCTEIPDTDSGIPWYIWLIITCILVLVLLLALFVIVPYILWKRRVIPIMKFVHHFQGYEDQDGREWDVFLSCPPQAQSFVAQILLPKLEDELGLKTLIHYRGISLDNSVTEAMHNSRRLLYVVTPDNVHPDGPGFESSTAVTEMLQHKHRVISVIFESISGEPRKSKSKIASRFKAKARAEYKVTTLETIDSTRQCTIVVNPLVWPGWNSEDQLDRFWTRLELCLPKKRVRSRQVRSENGRQRNGKIPSQSSTEARNGHRQIGQNGHSVAHIRTEYETDHYHKINGMSRL